MSNKQSVFNYRFTKQVKGHLSTHGISLEGNVLVCCSGGVDSMSLLHLIKEQFHLAKVSVLYFHHQTRTGQDLDEALIKDVCSRYRMTFYQEKLGPFECANFEAMARMARQKVLKKYQESFDWILQAHHLDDSFEWSLMQNFRSSQLLSAVGIPLRRGKILRPFMSVSKKQILRYAHLNKLKWREDPTNASDVHLRNYLRLHIIPLIQKKFPHYLKHYASRSNEWIKLYQTSQNFIEGSKGIFIPYSNLNKQSLAFAAKKLSSGKRGSWDQQFDKILKNCAGKKSGPLILSGGIHAYLDKVGVLLTSVTSTLGKGNGSVQYRAYSKEQIEQEWKSLAGFLEFFPFLVGFRGKSRYQKRKKHSMHPEMCQKIIDSGGHYWRLKEVLDEWPKGVDHLNLYLPWKE